jgi:hypothetical protein
MRGMTGCPEETEMGGRNRLRAGYFPDFKNKQFPGFVIFVN